MSENGCVFVLYTLTPLHAGAGESAGAIDLPVQREKHTEYPVVYSSSVKGSLRFYAETTGGEAGTKKFTSHTVKSIFGDEEKEGGEGKTVFTDAKLLLFPVRTSEGPFKWITCPFVIERLERDMRMLGLTVSSCKVDTAGPYEGISWQGATRTFLLEDIPVTVTLRAIKDDALFSLLKSFTDDHLDAASNILANRLIIVSNDVFKTLVTTATQVIARNVLDKKKKSTNLWYEECVPPDSLFYTAMLPTFTGSEVTKTLRDGIANATVQIGGNETIGYGFVKFSSDLSEKLILPAKEEEVK
jgi:CRISPR-associated protein Cmr4